MLAYNVEIWDRDWNFVGNRLVSDHANKEDYLSPSNNTIKIRTLPNVTVGGFLRIWCNDYNCRGIIMAVEEDDKGLMTVTYKPYICILQETVLFDTTKQGTYPLEQYIADVITARHISNTDAEENVSGLSVEVTSSTTVWDLGIKEAKEGYGYAIVKDFYASVIAPAMQNYGIVINTDVDYQAKTIKMTIGKNTAPVVTIEADLSNVSSKNISLRKTTNSKNKLTVYNAEDYTESKVYYLHTDGTYSTTDADRITPVVEEIKTVTVKQDQNFSDLADATAFQTFGSIKYNNLIELTISNEDALIKPNTLKIGQEVLIRSGGNIYASVLTGRNCDKQTTLIFGTIRLQLTKILGGLLNGN